MRTGLTRLLSVAIGLLVCVSAFAWAQAAPAQNSARTWIGREAELEAFLKSAQPTKIENLGTGVTRPKKATLAAGGPIAAMTWKPVKPGVYNGYRESYKHEIAAYELDKLLGLGMIPPTVERTIDGEMGAAVMWAAPSKSFKDLGGVPGQNKVPGPPAAQIGAWMRQLTRAKMFDNLIGNIDPNLGNWLVDPEWNLILIDHTRAFTTTNSLYHQMSAVDMELWNKMKALDEATLTGAVGTWLDKGAIRAMLQRRDKMQAVVDKLTR
jgi:hypothetical protein